MASAPKESIKPILGNFTTLKNAKELFSELNYEVAQGAISRRQWGKAAKEALDGDPSVIAQHGDFQIIYCPLASERLCLTEQRAVINTLLQEHPYALFLFSTKSQKQWHFVNVKLAAAKDEEVNRDTRKRRLFRRITIGQTTRIRTAVDRISMLDLSLVEPSLFGIAPLTIQAQHDRAFDVEAVTKEFYDAYTRIYQAFWDSLTKQTKDSRWAHDYALQFLNRVMFLYFIQRKGWLGDDPEFLETFWKTYEKSGKKDEFFEKWLTVLFFESFNNQKNLLNTKQRAYLPDAIRKVLMEAPYLNGGLFKPNGLDSKHKFEISDKQFREIFNFLQQFNFTITEDSPLDQEIAVDPEMIGKVYEGLVNVSDNMDERGEAGIFYTPRTEIDMMCRLSIVDQLANHIGEKHKNLFYDVAFAFDKEEKEQADTALAKAGLWKPIEERLNEITVLDPACGSGSFLVGMLGVLYDLITRAEKRMNKSEDPYELKKRIIGQSLYGVDVMDWAAHVAELRLWLSLVEHAEFTTEQLMIRNEPLLPHFTFKIRSGDSLVQEVGKVDFTHYGKSADLDPTCKRRLTELKNEKIKFYNNDPTCKFKTVEMLEQQEVLVFRNILETKIKAIEDKAKERMRTQARMAPMQQRNLLTGELEGAGKQHNLESAQIEKELLDLAEEKQRLETVLNGIRNKTTVPFVWDISFAEIFEDGSRGFDVVIGNPPYVRQESIAPPDPHTDRAKITGEDKKEYKAKLARSVYKTYPYYFGYSQKAANETVSRKLDAKSDLYLYFYFHGLSLLNGQGTFCFITSNSWLDVGYGADLQEFLLKRCQAKLIIDNKAKRSFKSADVNTIIALFGSPAEKAIKDDIALSKQAKFVMFNVPFEEVLHAAVFEEIAEAKDRKRTLEYRVFALSQRQLLDEGSELPEEDDSEEMPLKKAVRKTKSAGLLIKSAKYIGNKWGGKYLRAPDIYWAIIEKGKDKLVKLGEVSEVRFGLKTGANEFFYLDWDTIKSWGIEKEFLKPVLISPRECKSVQVNPKELKFKAFVCHKNKSELKNTSALEWIKAGEKQKFHERPSCRGRESWYDLPERDWAKILWPMIHNDRLNVFWNEKGVVVDHNLFEIVSQQDDLVWGSLSWTGQILFRELHGRANLGEGALKTEGIDIKTFYTLKSGSNSIISAIREIRNEFSGRSIATVREESQKPDRCRLDNLIFDVLQLTKTERDSVYEAAINLVDARLKKASSLEE